MSRYKDGLIKYCKKCGKAMPRRRNQQACRWAKTNYCSIRCSKLKVEPRICPICNIEFTPRQDLRMGKKVTYCSKKCADIAKVGVNYQPYVRIKKTCVICGSEFDVIPARQFSKHTCSKECHIVWLKKRIVSLKTRIKISQSHLKEKAYNWKGDNTTRIERKTLMSRMDYRIWRLSIFNRDNFTCQECGKRGIHLQAHHIKPWSIYPNLRYDINNGITLCKECHKKTDSYCGKIHNYKIKEEKL